jgi:hypothetical protein
MTGISHRRVKFQECPWKLPQNVTPHVVIQKLHNCFKTYSLSCHAFSATLNSTYQKDSEKKNHEQKR